MGGIVFKLFGIAAILILIVYMAASAFRRARRLDARIRAFRDEQDELTRRGRVQDPYAALAEIYTEDEKHERNKTHPSRRKRR
jgi:type II secretory pathway pseudopilin PulG